MTDSGVVGYFHANDKLCLFCINDTWIEGTTPNLMSKGIAFGFEARFVFDELVQHAIHESPGLVAVSYTHLTLPTIYSV